ncbi:MAG TPA: DUF3179 domain-containing protein [Thermoanaerobaculia bacterium]|nr:DUF3179 domain-containing protein [Thermoanaerobaculia bacterium]
MTFFRSALTAPAITLTGAALLFLLLVPPPAAGREEPAVDYGLVRELMSPERKVRRAAARTLLRDRHPSLIPVVVDALFFVPAPARDEAIGVLEELTGENRGRRYLDWVELVGAREDVAPPAGYREWKRSLLERIDPRFRAMLSDDAAVRLRLEELVWGGVRVEGIPALERPPKVSAREARFMRPGDRVFGVSLEGRHHAYPLKVLGWHEMVNDTLGGRPITLSYCTLCGSGVLYDTARDGDEPLTFGTSGLLYRSNKLMIDRQSGSLWSNLTGEAVVGAAAEAAGARLEMLPVTLTTWRRWLEAHPETTVAEPDPDFGKRFGYDYTEGAADRRREGVSFPVWQKSDRFDDKAEVLAIRLDGRSKAYELEALTAAGLLNDTLGDVPLLVLIAADGGARAYRRGGAQVFERVGPAALTDREGRRWAVGASALEPPEGSDLAPLERLPAHVAFWFGWYGFYPDTEVYPEAAEG